MNRDEVVYRTDSRPHLRSGDDLELTNSQLQATLESTADGILVVNHAGQIVEYNEQFRRLWGFPDALLPPRGDVAPTIKDEEVLQFAVSTLRHPREFLNKVNELYATPDATSFDVLEMLDGRVIERYSQPQRINGRPVGRVWSFRDVSHFVRAKRTLQHHNRILEQIAQGVPLPAVLHAIVLGLEGQLPGILCSILLADEAGRRLYPAAAPSLPDAYNQASHGIEIGPSSCSCGTAAYQRGKVIVADIDNDPRCDVRRPAAQAAGLRSCWSMPILATLEGSPSGQRPVVLGTCAVYRRTPGVPDSNELLLVGESAHLAALAIQRDRAERTIRNSEERYRLVTELSNTFAYQATISPDHSVAFRWLGGTFADLAGYQPEELEGLGWLQLMFPDDLPRLRAMTETLLVQPERSSAELEVRIRAKSGEIRWARSAIHLVRPWQPGDPVVIFGAVLDVTERKRAEHELAQRQADLFHTARLSTVGQMVAAISHEIAQPLTALGNLALVARELVESQAADTVPAALREHLLTIESQADRCRLILQRLRDYSRRRAGTRSTGELNAIVQESVALVANELRSLDVQIVWELTPQSLPAQVDRILIQQVIVNLLNNARDAVAEQPAERRRLVVRTQSHAHNAVIEVEDQGPGLSADQLSRIFEPFVSTKANGMGLGLNICQTIVRDHGGQIAARQNNLGGATFRVQIPLSVTATGGSHA